MNRLFTVILIFLFFLSCETKPVFQKEIVDQALENGKNAREGFSHSLKFVNGWLTKTDSITGLIPTNLTKSIDVWEPHNSAADNYAFPSA